MKTIYEKEFQSAADFVRWARVMRNDLRFNVNTGECGWIWPNGERQISQVGKRGGTVAANLSFMVGTVGGKMEHAADNALAKRLDETGGKWYFAHGE